jgi:membrane-associated protease RseP (regulator of RpoE activity)
MNKNSSIWIYLVLILILVGCQRAPKTQTMIAGNTLAPSIDPMEMTISANSLTPSPKTTTVEATTTENLKPPSDGFYLVEEKGLILIPGLDSDPSMDLAGLPHTRNALPVFSIMGNGLPLGYLHLNPYYAGIGVDFSYTETGGMIERVFENSPAWAAGLQPGDLILKEDGQPLKRPMVQIYTSGQRDLFGLMAENITLEVLSGTQNKTINLPRTYTATVTPQFITMQVQPPVINYSIEPMDGYVLIRINSPLPSGVYRFEFIGPYNGPSYGLGLPSSGCISANPCPTQPPTATPLPTAVPITIPNQKWVFVVKAV